MKKIFTLVLAAALAMPVFAAKVDVKLYEGVKGEIVSGTVTTISTGEFFGAYKNQEVSYDKENDTYMFTNFIGYDKFNFGLKLDPSKPQYKSGQIAIGVVTEYGTANSPGLSERNSIAYTYSTSALSAYFDESRGISSSVRMAALTNSNRDKLCYRSGEFIGDVKDYMIYQPRFNCIGTPANYNQTCRTYAIEDGDKIIFYLSATCYGLEERDKNGEWSGFKGTGTEADGDGVPVAQVRMFVIELTKGLEGGDDTPSAIAVDTYDEKMTTKVAESFNSELTYADGVYTLAGLYGQELDLQFKLGTYNSSKDQYAIEFENVEKYSSMYSYLLTRTGKYAVVKPVEINASGIPSEIGDVLITTSKSYITKQNDEYKAFVVWAGIVQNPYGYTPDYILTFSWTDPNAGVDGVVADNENAPVEYYNLQGVRVENPSAGLYIKRQGNKVEKVVIR